jgi:hypothetical protein
VIEAETRRAIAEFDHTLSRQDDAAKAIEAGFVFLVRYVRGARCSTGCCIVSRRSCFQR